MLPISNLELYLLAVEIYALGVYNVKSLVTDFVSGTVPTYSLLGVYILRVYNLAIQFPVTHSVISSDPLS